MRDGLASLVVATAAAVVLSPSGAYAARSCDGSTAASFQYRLGDVRYDSPDPSKANGLATIAASLQSTSQTPLYECVGQWPESWAGWYDGGSSLIWGDCIWTGAGAGQDETVSFAVDWKSKTMYLAHTFACSNKQGSEGLATGSIKLDFNCTTADGDSYCVPKSTAAGARPTLNITTKLLSAALNSTSTCTAGSKQYQSWKVENWLRRIEMKPGSSPTDANLVSDSGPTFTLKNLVTSDSLSCTNSGKQNGAFVGTCQSQSANAINPAASFSFDPKLNILEISQHWKCNDSSSFDAVGVGYMQAACEHVFNSDQFTCTSAPVWIGTGVV